MHTAPEKIRLLIVEDHAVVRADLAAFLSVAQGIGEVRVASSGEDALRLCEASQPDIALLDLRMPGMDGQDTLVNLLKKWPGIRVIILTGQETLADAKLALRNGAAAFISKNVEPAFLVQVIHDVSTGGCHFPQLPPADTHSDCGLSGRELEVLRLLVCGYTNDEIGRTLGVAGQTIKGHLKRIFPKLDAANRAEAVSRAYELHLV